MVTEAIVLAGGLGTRLKSVVSELPKAMAPINDRPFLEIILSYLAKEGVSRVVLSVGYKHEAILTHFGRAYKGISLDYAVEEEPLGTGGGILLALSQCRKKEVLAVNGDTLFPVSIASLLALHQKQDALATLALKPMQNFDRYGTVRLSGSRVAGFEEKKSLKEGLINGGAYILNRDQVLGLGLPKKCSWEKDFLEGYYQSHFLAGLPCEDYFIDIGIPEDYRRAQLELDALGY